MESFKRASTISSLINPGEQIMTVAEARMITFPNDGSLNISLALSDDDGHIISGLVPYAGPKLPDGTLSEFKDQRQIKKRHEFLVAIGANPSDDLDVDTADKNRLPLVEGKSVKVSIGVTTDKKTGYTMNSIKQFLPMSV